MSDIPKQPLSHRFFEGGLSDRCIAYMMAEEVQSEREHLQVALVLDVFEVQHEGNAVRERC